MKIAIDVSSIIYGTGVSTYTSNLVGNLLKLDNENEYVLYGSSLRRRGELKRQVNSFPGSFKSKVFPIPPILTEVVWNRLHIIPIELFTGRIDLFHTSDWTQPPANAVKVSTVHDLSPILYPKTTNTKIVSAHKSAFGWMKKEVKRIIAPSYATKNDLCSLGIDENIITVIPEAVDSKYRKVGESKIDALRVKFKIHSNYLLSVGVGPRKNTQNIIKAFELSKAGRDMKLLIVGHDHYNYPEVRGVRFLGHVEKSDLIALYSGADAMVYPSLYEGFGLPILEAFSCECPVVTSNQSSMPEVAGDAAVLVDPNDLHSISEGIITALKDRTELIKKGKKRAAQFSWEKTAKDTLDVYKKALEK